MKFLFLLQWLIFCLLMLILLSETLKEQFLLMRWYFVVWLQSHSHLTLQSPQIKDLFGLIISGWHHVQVHAQYKPSKEMLKKIWRWCTREMDYESDDRVESWSKQFNVRMGTENRHNMLYNLEYKVSLSMQDICLLKNEIKLSDLQYCVFCISR